MEFFKLCCYITSMGLVISLPPDTFRQCCHHNSLAHNKHKLPLQKKDKNQCPSPYFHCSYQSNVLDFFLLYCFVTFMGLVISQPPDIFRQCCHISSLLHNKHKQPLQKEGNIQCPSPFFTTACNPVY